MGEVRDLTLQPYRAGEAAALVGLFYDTVHTVCGADYTPEELDAWADGKADAAAWERSLLQHHTLVARVGETIVGFADADGDYLDRLYVHGSYLRQGVATALAEALEQQARAAGHRKMVTHASITARPFFQGRGYRVVRRQQVERHGVLLTNFVMEKALA